MGSWRACVLCRHCDGEGGVVQLHYGFDEYKDRLRTGKDKYEAADCVLM